MELELESLPHAVLMNVSRSLHQAEVRALRAEATALREESASVQAQCHALERRLTEAQEVRGNGNGKGGWGVSCMV